MCKLSICIVMLKVPCVAFHSYTFYPAHNISDCLSEVDSPYLFVFLGFNLHLSPDKYVTVRNAEWHLIVLVISIFRDHTLPCFSVPICLDMINLSLQGHTVHFMLLKDLTVKPIRYLYLVIVLIVKEIGRLLLLSSIRLSFVMLGTVSVAALQA
jgi:hypothetical protein